MADNRPWAQALRANRVQWEQRLPLNDIISQLHAEGLLGQYVYEDIKAEANMIKKHRLLIDWFLTEDETCIKRLDEIVHAQDGFKTLKLNVPCTPALPPSSNSVEGTDFEHIAFDDACQQLREVYAQGCPMSRQFPPLLPRSQKGFYELMLTRMHPFEDNNCKGTSVDAPPPLQGVSDLLLQLEMECERGVILAEGVAGIGKTFLAFKVAEDWARRSALKSYDVVLLLELRSNDLSKVSTLHELLAVATGGLSRESMDLIADKVRVRRGRRVLFVLDGVDEAPDIFRRNSSALLWKMVNGEHAETVHSSFLMTSRPMATIDLHNTATLRVQIQGFSKETIDSVLEKWETRGTRLSGHMEQHFLTLLCRVPLNLATAISCARLQDISITNITSIFETFAVSLMSQGDPDITGLGSLPEFKQSLLKEASRVAYEGIRTSTFLFSEDDFESKEPIKQLVAWGLLYPVTTMPAQYGFPHHMFQEFLAAWHLSHLDHHGFQQCLRNDIFAASGGRSKFAIVFRFFSGLTKLKHEHLQELSSLLHSYLKPDPTVSHWSERLENMLTILHGAQEANNMILLNEAVGHFVARSELVTINLPCGHLFHSLDFSTIRFALNHSQLPWSLSINGCHVSKGNLGMLCLPGDETGWGLQDLTLMDVTITEEGSTVLHSLVKNYQPCLRSLRFLTLPSFPTSIITSLVDCHLETLALRNCNLTPECMTAIAQFLGQVTTLKSLDVSNNPNITGSGVECLLGAVANSTCLQELDISSCCLGSSGPEAIKTQLKKSSSLRKLFLVDRTTTAEAIISMLRTTDAIGGLTVLQLAAKFQYSCEGQSPPNLSLEFRGDIDHLLAKELQCMTDEIDAIFVRHMSVTRTSALRVLLARRMSVTLTSTLRVFRHLFRIL